MSDFLISPVFGLKFITERIGKTKIVIKATMSKGSANFESIVFVLKLYTAI
jgi:hypothetical protein